MVIKSAIISISQRSDFSDFGPNSYATLQDMFDKVNNTSISVTNLILNKETRTDISGSESYNTYTFTFDYDTDTLINTSGFKFGNGYLTNAPYDNTNTNTIIIHDLTNVPIIYSHAFYYSKYLNFDYNSVNNCYIGHCNSLLNTFNNSESFNANLSGWDTSHIQSMKNMFNGATSFNQDISNWDTSNVSEMSNMFKNATSFNKPIGDWDTSNITNMTEMFTGATGFKQYINDWTSPVKQDAIDSIPEANRGFATTKISSKLVIKMLKDSTKDVLYVNDPTSLLTELCQGGFTPSLSICNVDTTTDAVYNIYSLDFGYSDYNVDTVDNNFGIKYNGKLNTTNENELETIEAYGFPIMYYCFSTIQKHKIECDLNNLRIDHLTSFPTMFRYAERFNGDISNWDTSKITSMNNMFSYASAFNGDISNWDTSNVTDMGSMFTGATAFNQYIGDWTSTQLQNAINTLPTAEQRRVATLKNPSKIVIKMLKDSTNDLLYVNDPESLFNKLHKNKLTLNNVNTTVDTTTDTLYNIYSLEFGYSDYNVDTVDNNFGITFNGVLSTFNEDEIEVIEAYGFPIRSNLFSSINKVKIECDLNNLRIDHLTSFKFMFYSAQRFNGDISNWDTSKITTMNNMFSSTQRFNGDISNWDTRNVEDMSDMFSRTSAFNQPLNWDTSNVENMSNMFQYAIAFNSDLSFNTINVKNMSYMFSGATAFNKPLNWDTSNVENMSYMFTNATSFNQSLNWDTSNVINMSNMFSVISYQIPSDISNRTSVFNSDLSFNTINVKNMGSMFQNATAFNKPLNWDTSNVTYMSSMFHTATAFNSDLSFNTTNVNDMSYMFNNATVFNQPLNLDTISVTNMSYMFSRTSAFNQPLNWDTSNVTDMKQMFANATAFNKPLNWDTSNVENMDAMFYNASKFIQPLNWNTSNVTNMQSMFRNATEFNGDISNWDIGKVTSMGSMFRSATEFNGDISNWDTSNVTSMQYMFYNASKLNGDISNWDISKVTSKSYMFYSTTSLNQYLPNFISKGGFAIPVTYTNASITIQSDDGSAITDNDISSLFSGITVYNQSPDSTRNTTEGILVVNFQYKKNELESSTEGLVYGDFATIYPNCKIIAMENVPLSNSIGQYFLNNKIKQDIDLNSCFIEHITDMMSMFSGCNESNPDISMWNTKRVTNMGYMFNNCNKFNRDIGNWNVSNVTDMERMFKNATSFNQDITKWKLRGDVNNPNMFDSANAFYQNVTHFPQTNASTLAGLEGRVTEHMRLVVEINDGSTFSESNKSNFENHILNPTNTVNNNMNGVSNYTVTYNDAETIGTVELDFDPYKVDTIFNFWPGRLYYDNKLKNIYITELDNVPINVNSFKDAKFLGMVNPDPESSTSINNYFNGTIDLNKCYIKHLKSLSYMFGNTTFSYDISQWDTSHITDMSTMFMFSNFDGDISKWDTSSVKDMRQMFRDTPFNGDITNWDTSNVTDMYGMFFKTTQFNRNISNWDTSKVTNFTYIFYESSKFNQYIGGVWDTSSAGNTSSGITSSIGSYVAYKAVGQSHTNTTFSLDINEVNSVFNNCDITFSSGAKIYLKDCKFNDCTFTFSAEPATIYIENATINSLTIADATSYESHKYFFEENYGTLYIKEFVDHVNVHTKDNIKCNLIVDNYSCTIQPTSTSLVDIDGNTDTPQKILIGDKIKLNNSLELYNTDILQQINRQYISSKLGKSITPVNTITPTII